MSSLDARRSEKFLFDRRKRSRRFEFCGTIRKTEIPRNELHPRQLENLIIIGVIWQISKEDRIFGITEIFLKRRSKRCGMLIQFSDFDGERDSSTLKLPDRGAYRSLTLQVENRGPLSCGSSISSLTITGKVEALVRCRETVKVNSSRDDSDNFDGSTLHARDNLTSGWSSERIFVDPTRNISYVCIKGNYFNLKPSLVYFQR